MEEIAVQALDPSWSDGVGPIEVATFLPEAPEGIIVETRILYQRRVIIAEQRCWASGGIAPSLHGIWKLYLISGSDRTVKLLTGVKSMKVLLQHLGTQFEDVPTLMGSDIRVQVILPTPMRDPHDPPPTFLIHVE